ncbi:MAG TPA: hypothetical protein VLF87_01775 [Patescibacteria group bacterium]|nr:hypothetical protein [Patescibacteria group bacterium]
MAAKPTQLLLPAGVVTRSDVGRLLQETESVDNFLQQSTIRQPGTAVQLPKTSNLFDEMVASNHLNLLEKVDRQQLAVFLKTIYQKAPLLHVSFNTDPSPLFTQRLMTWIRQEMHPYVLLQIGLHPSIGAGCVVRTTNKYFDFSLRQRFKDQRVLLISKLREGREQATAQQGAAVHAPVVKPEAAHR